jgi:hypothetical protein
LARANPAFWSFLISRENLHDLPALREELASMAILGVRVEEVV